MTRERRRQHLQSVTDLHRQQPDIRARLIPGSLSPTELGAGTVSPADAQLLIDEAFTAIRAQLDEPHAVASLDLIRNLWALDRTEISQLRLQLALQEIATVVETRPELVAVP